MSNERKYVHSGPLCTSGRAKIIQTTGRHISVCLVDGAFSSREDLVGILDRFKNKSGVSVTISFDEPEEKYHLEETLVGLPVEPVATFNDKIEEIMNAMGLTSNSNLTLKDVHMRIRASMKLYRDFLLNEDVK